MLWELPRLLSRGSDQKNTIRALAQLDILLKQSSFGVETPFVVVF